MGKVSKKLKQYGNDLNALIADVEGDKVEGDNVVFVMMEDKPVEDDLVVMKVSQFFELAMPSAVASLVLFLAHNRGGG